MVCPSIAEGPPSLEAHLEAFAEIADIECVAIGADATVAGVKEKLPLERRGIRSDALSGRL